MARRITHRHSMSLLQYLKPSMGSLGAFDRTFLHFYCFWNRCGVGRTRSLRVPPANNSTVPPSLLDFPWL
jgi:hypothetical protein